MVEVLANDWSESFALLVRDATDTLSICSPYIGLEPCIYLSQLVESSVRDRLKINLLTNLSYENMLSRATDVKGLMQLYDVFQECDIRFLPTLHAKVYTTNKSSIVTSANFTRSGFYRNQEYGLMVCDQDIVARVYDDAQRFHAIGTPISREELAVFDGIVEELSELQRGILRSAKKSLKEAFEQKSRDAEKELLQLRAKMIGAHAGFAETIRFILKKRGHATTQDIYSEVQAIHSDLCDDSVRLVISGVEWTQAKWKHRVRHAQQFLSRRNEIMNENGVWRLQHDSPK